MLLMERNNFFFLAVLTILCFGVSRLSAQKMLSLEEALKTGLASNFDLRIERKNVNILENENHLGRAGRLPVVNAEANWINSLNYSRLQFISGDEQVATNAFNTNLTGGVEALYPLYDGGKARNRHEILGYRELIGKRGLEVSSQMLIANITAAYYAIQLQLKLIDVIKEQVAFGKKRLRLSEVSKEIGSASSLDLMQSQIDLRTDSSELIRQKNMLEVLKVNLFQLINIKPDTAIIFEAFSIPEKPAEYSILLEQLLRQNPEILQRRAETLLADANIDLARSERRPTVNVFGGIGGVYSRSAVGFVLSNIGVNPYAGLNLSYPLFDGKVRKINLQNAILSREVNELNLERTIVDLSNQLFSAYTNYKNALELLDLESQNVRFAARNSEIALVSYEIGGISEIELRTIQLTLLDAELRKISTTKLVADEQLNIYRLTGELEQIIQ